MITGQQLKQLAPNLDLSLAIKIADLLDKICPIYGINKNTILHDFLANCIHESAGFTRCVEGLNYQTVALIKKFGRHRISVDDCYRYGRTLKQKANQVMIANILYGGDWGFKNLGNVKKDDGWNLRGSGPMQITGRMLCTKFAKYYNRLKGTSYTTEQISELLRTSIEVGIHGACWLFCVEKRLIDEAISDKVVAIRKSINGGTFGLDEVIKLTNKAQSILT